MNRPLRVRASAAWLFAASMMPILLCACGTADENEPAASASSHPDPSFNYLVGRGIRDVTGAPFGIQMWGFVKEGQVTEGIHLRQFARAFVIAEPEEAGKRLAFVSIDLGSVTGELATEVVDRLRERFGDTYSTANVIVSATHTHAGPGGFWHTGAGTALGSPFNGEYFDYLAAQIAGVIGDAHDDLEPGKVMIASGEVDGAGAQRSAMAYQNNPEEERAKYSSDTDKTMTLLRFEDASGTIGILNWFAVHPTAMTFDNKLISGDHKGYASRKLEREMNSELDAVAGGTGFVAAFAQSNCGDVTANLNLDNTGPGGDEFETTSIIGDRQYQMAIELMGRATERLEGPIESIQTHVDLSDVQVESAFTGGEAAHTCPSAYGYSFAAGSTEDGGGHPLFHEGMTKRLPMIDSMVKTLFPIPPPTDECRECQGAKAILIAPGEPEPPLYPQVHSIGLARVGQWTMIVGPAEFTTMAGRRIREGVAAILGEQATAKVVIAGYANGYAGYVTTNEEYETQQYEGGHTLFGPWTLAAYRQEYSRLAKAMKSGSDVEDGPEPMDLRGSVESEPLGSGGDVAPEGVTFGDVATQPPAKAAPGDVVEVTFWTVNPSNRFPGPPSYGDVERETDGEWETYRVDADWESMIRWSGGGEENAPFQATVIWAIPNDTSEGRYRLVHRGLVAGAEGEDARPFRGESDVVEVEESQ